MPALLQSLSVFCAFEHVDVLSRVLASVFMVLAKGAWLHIVWALSDKLQTGKGACHAAPKHKMAKEQQT